MPDITACFLANVPEDYAMAIDHVDDLATIPLPLEYAPYETTGYIGIPTLNGTPCFPMFGMYVGPLSSDNPPPPITLKRLLSKMEFNLKVDMTPGIDYDGTDIALEHSANANFTLYNYTINNLPKQIKLAEKTAEGVLTAEITESPWGDNPSGYEFMAAQNVDHESNPPQIYDKDNALNTVSELHTFYCYVPEYALLPNGNEKNYSALTLNKERYKPLLFDEGQKPIYLTLEGRLAQQNGSFSNVRYEVYLGENNFDSFSMFRNNLYRNNLTIGGADHLNTGDDSKVDHRVDILPLNLVEAYGQAANCYIISLPGTYEIDTYKGVVKTLSSAAKLTGKSASVLWNTNSDNTITASLSENKTKVILNVNATSSNAVEPGNALIALHGDDGILWSWHIWFCTDDNRADNPAFLDKYVDEAGAYNGYQVMDRALGATDMDGWTLGDYKLTMWKDGLYYQWGRKDPLRLNADGTTVFDDANNSSDGTSSGASYANSIKNPQAFYSDWSGTYTSEDPDASGWNANKSVNDPCPPGYKVPSNAIWRSKNPDATKEILGTKLTNDERYTYNTSQLSLTGSASTFIFYPYGGNIEVNGSKVGSRKSTLTSTTDSLSIYSENVPTPGSTSTGYSPLSPVQYKLISYSFEQSVGHGSFWANNKKNLQYGYSIFTGNSSSFLGSLLSTIPIVQCYKRTGTAEVTKQESASRGRTKYNYGEVSWNEWNLLENKDLNLGEKYNLSNYLKNTYFKKVGTIDSYAYYIDESMSISSGLQVRCVKE